MFQLTPRGVASKGTADLERLRTQFSEQQCVRLPALVDAALLTHLQSQIDVAQFEDRVHASIGTELCMAPNPTLSLLHFLINDAEVFRVVSEMTACGHIGCFTGRVYRMSPGRGHYDSWHSDAEDHRIVGMSLNLGRASYSGGIFQLRDRRSSALLCEVANTVPGDAIMFRIADHLVHQVSPMEGSVDKTAFAGWFESEPDFISLLKRL